MQVQQCVACIQAAARRCFPKAEAKLFGSQANGLATKGSDCDVSLTGVLDDVIAAYANGP